ncbi:MAG: YdeI/OmpD-associated family protein [Chloroflexota bacterium]
MPLKRIRHPMPEFIRDDLSARSLMDAYYARPEYQQNDYVGWVTRAKRKETRQKRLAQMLDEIAGFSQGTSPGSRVCGAIA